MNAEERRPRDRPRLRVETPNPPRFSNSSLSECVGTIVVWIVSVSLDPLPRECASVRNKRDEVSAVCHQLVVGRRMPFALNNLESPKGVGVKCSGRARAEFEEPMQRFDECTELARIVRATSCSRVVWRKRISDDWPI